ncbi:MAG: glycosyltransferase family 4 protein [Deltaproteobacteria bacterium]|nr:glycosyltransferase family 4 protein [Deltaproteobacteria bacterium]
MAGTRIAYILLWFPEPSQTFVLDEVNTLVRLGAAVKVYTLYGPRPPSQVAGMGPAAAPVQPLGTACIPAILKELVCSLRNSGGEARRFLIYVLKRRWRSWESAGEALWAALAGFYLAPRFLREGVGHIHAPWADGPATAAWVASGLSGIPFSFCARAHDVYPPDGALKEKLAAAAFVRAESRATRNYLVALAPGAAPKLTVIYNGLPLPANPAPPRPPQPPYRLTALGRFVEKKGFAGLLLACRHLRDQGLDFRLTLAGDGPQRRRLCRLIREYNLEEQVELPGFVPHRRVPDLLRGSDLFIMPSRIDPSGDRDGIPTVILEALAHEVPVVATAVSGLPEVIHPGETGWLVPPDDPLALAQAVMEALSRPKEAHRRARVGRRLVSREFDSLRNYARLKALLESRGTGTGPTG